MKKIKKFLNGTIVRISPFLILALFLAGCMRRDADGNPTGFVYQYFVIPSGYILDQLASLLGSYGIAIIVITVVVRLVLMPLNFSQMKKQMMQQEKMALVKPELDKVQAEVKAAKTMEEKNAASLKMQQVYKNNGISMTGGLGCLPLLLQMPIFIGLYNAIVLSESISQSTFLGISLGEPTLILTILVGIVYLGQSYLMMQGIPESQRAQMKTMTYMNPAMMIFLSFSSPAGLQLYWLIGGVLVTLQTFLQNKFIKPKIKAQLDEEFKNKPRPVVSDIKEAKPVVQSSKKQTKKKDTGRNRNQGRQNHKKHR